MAYQVSSIGVFWMAIFKNNWPVQNKLKCLLSNLKTQGRACSHSRYGKDMPEELVRKVKWRARPGFEPGTSRTLSENHTPRPTSPVGEGAIAYIDLQKQDSLSRITICVFSIAVVYALQFCLVYDPKHHHLHLASGDHNGCFTKEQTMSHH